MGALALSKKLSGRTPVVWGSLCPECVPAAGLSFGALLQRREQARVELARKRIVVIDTVTGPAWKRARELEQ